MYLPSHFREDRVPVLHQLIRAHPLATLVTLRSDGLGADHVPMEIAAEGALGVLRGHVSRANPMWQSARLDVDALAIFQGAQGYITPAWYATKAETGRVVPTWNYAVVHASGPLRVVHDPAWLRALVERLTDRHERDRSSGKPHAGDEDSEGARPWRVADAPAGYIDGQLRGIVGLEIPLTRLEGKWKVSQNRSPEDRAAVVAGLRAAGDPASLALADLVAASLAADRTQTQDP